MQGASIFYIVGKLGSSSLSTGNVALHYRCVVVANIPAFVFEKLCLSIEKQRRNIYSTVVHVQSVKWSRT